LTLGCGDPSSTDALDSIYADDAMHAFLLRDPRAVVHAVCYTATLLDQVAARHGLVLNFVLGNTEVNIALRGKGVSAVRNRIATSAALPTPRFVCFGRCVITNTLAPWLRRLLVRSK
jgi:hypothetical protein